MYKFCGSTRKGERDGINTAITHLSPLNRMVRNANDGDFNFN
jgi:hypothetical protein